RRLSRRALRTRFDRKDYGRGRGVFFAKRHLPCRRHALRAGVDCVELYPRRRDRLWPGTQRWPRRKSQASRQGARPFRKSHPGDLHRMPGAVSTGGCIVAALLAENLAVEASSPTLRMSGLIIIPQIIVAILAPWVGYHSEARGRRSLLLLGFGLEPVCATLLAFTASYPFAIVAPVLDGISAAIITVLTVLVVTDLTTGTGRFNLAR